VKGSLDGDTESGPGFSQTTRFVKTREGGRGLLQIVSFSTNNPPEVRIRYKLVQPSDWRSRIAANQAPAAGRASTAIECPTDGPGMVGDGH
jgi:hypothetical protein